MNKPTTLAVIGGACWLAGCSALIPPQTVPDPLGIAGQQVRVEIGSAALTGSSTNGLGQINTSFNDLDTSQLPFQVTLSQTLFKVGFSADTKLLSSTVPLPCTIILTRVDINVTLKDAGRTVTLPTFKVNKVVQLEQQAADPTAYRVITPEVFVGNVLSGDEVKQLQDIITTGGSNQAEVRLSVQATSVPDLPPGSVLTFTFGTAEATLAF